MSLPSDLAGWMPTSPNPVVNDCDDARLMRVSWGGCGICRNGVYLFLCQPNGWVDARVMWGSRWDSGAVPQP